MKLVVRVAGVDIAVTLAPGVSGAAGGGLLGLRREDHPDSDLIKGLAITSAGTVQTGAQVYAATKVTFKPEDMKTAKAIAAGTEEAKQKIVAEQTENKRRLAEDKRARLAGERAAAGPWSASSARRPRPGCTSTPAARRSTPRASRTCRPSPTRPWPRPARWCSRWWPKIHRPSTGNAASNQRLSAQRASAVTAYLLQKCNLPPEKIATAGGLGSYIPVENEEPGAGSAQNQGG